MIRPAAPLAVPLLDISGLPAAERQRRVEQETAAEGAAPFDLEHDTMLAAFQFFGLVPTIIDEAPQHPNGPAFTFVAQTK